MESLLSCLPTKRAARLSLFFLLFCPLFLRAQTPKINQLEQELISASGALRAQKLIDLADANIEAGLFDRAADRAEEAEDLAKRLRLSDLRAAALNRQGKALARLDKKGLFGKNRPAPRFQASNEILRETRSTNTALFVDNLENLRSLAEKAGKTQEIALLAAEIARVKNGGVAAATTYSTEGGGKVDAKQELSRLEQEKAALNQKLEQQLSAAASASKKSEELTRQTQAMQAQLAAKEAAISQMTEEQVKAELSLLQQRQMLDSLTFKSSLDSINLLNKELAVKSANDSRNFLLAAAVALLLLLGGSTYSFVKARQHAKQIQIEQKRSEDLLLNILPALVAKELKKQGYTEPQFHDDVAVLFADFVGFSKIAEKLPPSELVRELDTCFKAFDEIIQRNGLEKIKTIGDAYMAASGLNNLKLENKHIFDMVKAAQEMQDWLNTWNAQRDKRGQPRFDARIGIHAGPVVAGVVGSKKFAFDIWGDTVNIAARVEQAGEGGKINISGMAYERVKDFFKCHYRGAIEAKNKGNIEMYFVES